MLCCIQCIVSGEENPPNSPLPLGIALLRPEEDRATAIGNMRKNGKDRACGSGDMLADRQTDKQTHTDVLITILRHRSCVRSKKKLDGPYLP